VALTPLSSGESKQGRLKVTHMAICGGSGHKRLGKGKEEEGRRILNLLEQ